MVLRTGKVVKVGVEELLGGKFRCQKLVPIAATERDQGWLDETLKGTGALQSTAPTGPACRSMPAPGERCVCRDHWGQVIRQVPRARRFVRRRQGSMMSYQVPVSERVTLSIDSRGLAHERDRLMIERLQSSIEDQRRIANDVLATCERFVSPS